MVTSIQGAHRSSTERQSGNAPDRADLASFTSRSYTALVRSFGLRQEFITLHMPEQNGMVEQLQ